MKPRSFGNYLRQKRVAAGLSLRSVADYLDISHVYLSEVERGVHTAMPRSHWPALVKIIPDLTIDDLERAALQSRPMQLSLEDAPPKYQDLALALARRIEDQDLSDRSLSAILRILEGPKR